MEKHFVTFFSPGFFVSEEITKEISSWNISEALTMVKSIEEQYGAKPYGFRYTTRSRNEVELDSKIINHSSMYYYSGLS